MKVLFVFSTVDVGSVKKPIGDFTNIHIGLSYIASILRTRGHTTRLVVLCSEMVRAACRIVDRAMAEYDPHVDLFYICIHTVSVHPSDGRLYSKPLAWQVIGHRRDACVT